MKILVASPTYEGMNYCFEKFIEHLKNISYPDFKIVLFDNSRTKKYWRKIKSLAGVKVIYDNTNEETNMYRLVSSRNKILDYAIEKEFDYLLMLDSDVLVPKDILNKLLSHKKDVVSGLYFNYFRNKGKLAILPVCYKKLEKEKYSLYEKELPEVNLDVMHRQLTNKEAKSGKLLEVSIPSAGCVLLSRKAFSSGARYGFIEEMFKLGHKIGPTEDTKFFRELREEGFKIYCDTSVICGHDVKTKYKSNKGLHPFYEGVVRQ